MATLKINYSEAQVKKATPTNISGLAIDPYYSSVAGAGFTKLGGFVDKIIKDTRVQNDKNEARKKQIEIDEVFQSEYSKYSTSSNPADVKTFIENTDFKKFKKILKGSSKSVNNMSEAYVLKSQQDLRWKLLSQITTQHTKETLKGDQDDLDKITLGMASNDVTSRSNAYGDFNRWFGNSNNSSKYSKDQYAKLKDDKLTQAKRYQLAFGIKNDPFSILRNPKLLNDAGNDFAVMELWKKATVAAIDQQTQVDWDNIQMEEASVKEKLNNFATIVVRLNRFKETENWRSEVPTLDDISDMVKQDQLNSVQGAALIDFFANPNKVSDSRIRDMINAQLSVANNVNDIDDLEQQISFDAEFAAKLNIKDIAAFQAKFEKYKSNFPLAQEAQILEEQLATNMGKVSSLGGNIISKKSSGMTTQEKMLRDQATTYYNDLVYNKKVLPSDAYIQSLEKFASKDRLPTIYDVMPLTSIKLKPPLDTKKDQDEYFLKARTEIADTYRNGKIDIKVFQEDLAKLDLAEDLFEIRSSLYGNDFAFKTQTAAKQRTATVEE
tara:strand:+ start:3275 stop:4927 length:1653 start_codon:yes stop_codon:yes gene_type:complete